LEPCARAPSQLAAISWRVALRVNAMDAAMKAHVFDGFSSVLGADGAAGVWQPSGVLGPNAAKNSACAFDYLFPQC
jgi:hypothetical protein